MYVHVCVCVCVCVCVWCTCTHMHAQSSPTLCDPMDYSPPGSSVHGISQARILERVAISSSRGASQPRDQTCISYVSCTGKADSLPTTISAPNFNTAEVSWEDKGTNITNKLFCTRSQQEPAKREGKREMDKQARREEWLNNMPKMLEDVSELNVLCFLSGPVAKTPDSQCRGPAFDSWSGN